MTAETLRHYDRIGICHPHKVDEWTGYRYYSEQEIVRLNTISVLKSMDLSLDEIKQILDYNDFGKIVELLNKAEKSADEKIKSLKEIKTRIQRAKSFYEIKSANKEENTIFIQELPARVIMISPDLTSPTVGNLWNYLRHFYSQIDNVQRDDYAFEDLAGIVERNGKSNMFAVCTKHVPHKNLQTLPAGKYLCANCTEENREKVVNNMLEIVKNQYNLVPKFTVQIVVLTGILQWDYLVQIPIF